MSGKYPSTTPESLLFELGYYLNIAISLKILEEK